MLVMDRRDHGVVVLRLAHGKVNVLDVDLLEAIIVAFGELGEARAVVLTGDGTSFSAGVDLRRILDNEVGDTEHFLDALSRALLTVFTHPRPVVAAVNGHAIAGGCVLAAAADVRLMSGGSMGLTELKVGVAFPTAALEIVRYATGAQAVEVGLIDRVVAPENLLDTALAEARTLTQIPAETYEISKRQLHGPAMAAIAREYEIYDAGVARTWTSDRGRTAMSAFVANLTQSRS
jgi:enoyl-CoA hydratase